MPRYQKIHSQLWHDEKICRLSDNAKLLFLYILSCPHSNSIGIFVLKKGYICSDLDWNTRQLKNPFEELIAKNLILYDETVNLLCIPGHLKHNPIENENQAKAASKNIQALPLSSLYQRVLKLLHKPYHKQLRELLQEQYREQIPEPETETLQKTETETERRNITETKGFEQFWKVYPRKKSKGQAEKAWNKIKPDESLLKIILGKIDCACKSSDWTKDNGVYIPHPATWLNAKGWEDEYIKQKTITDFLEDIPDEQTRV